MCFDTRTGAKYDKPILIHVTSDDFKLLKEGGVTHVYRPRSVYYMRRLEKVRDYISFMNSNMANHHVYIEFRKAYEKPIPDSWLICRVKSITFIRLKDAPFKLREIYWKCKLEDWFYDVELAS